eukprot:1105030-Pyramimonas_sp.AAC.1
MPIGSHPLGSHHGDDTDDRADEDGKQLPRLDGNTGRRRDEPEDETACNRNAQVLHVRSLGRRGRSNRSGRVGLDGDGAAGAKRGAHERGLLERTRGHGARGEGEGARMLRGNDTGGRDGSGGRHAGRSGDRCAGLKSQKTTTHHGDRHLCCCESQVMTYELRNPRAKATAPAT